MSSAERRPSCLGLNALRVQHLFPQKKADNVDPEPAVSRASLAEHNQSELFRDGTPEANDVALTRYSPVES